MSIEVACGIMFLHKDTFLIGLRPKNTEDEGYWEFPGGKRENDEDIISCLKREWREELNLEICVDEEIFSYNHNNYLCRFFKGQILDIQNLKINIHEQIKFVNKNTVLSYKLFSDDKKIIAIL